MYVVTRFLVTLFCACFLFDSICFSSLRILSDFSSSFPRLLSFCLTLYLCDIAVLVVDTVSSLHGRRATFKSFALFLRDVLQLLLFLCNRAASVVA